MIAGRKVLHAARAVGGRSLRILNVDAGYVGIGRFLEASGAQRSVRQIEMYTAP